MIKGSIAALITPMFPDGRIDVDSLRALVNFHISEGSDGIVVAGTTGESPTLSLDEYFVLIRTVIDQAGGRIPVIANTGSNSTAEAIDLTHDVKQLGADAVLTIAPYYNKPTQEGLYQHFKAVAGAVDIPVILYNVPGRTGCDISNDTVRRLAHIPNIVGIKDATGDIARGTDLLLTCPQGFAVYSGDDETALALLLLGGDGVISVTANVVPGAMHNLCAAAFRGDLRSAGHINNMLFPLHQKLFVETNPIPVKWLASHMGLVQDGIRLPLTRLSPVYHDELRLALQRATGETVGICRP